MSVIFEAKIPIGKNFSGNSYRVSNKPMESKEQEALWCYNRSLAHDGLPPAERLPKGTTFKRLNVQ